MKQISYQLNKKIVKIWSLLCIFLITLGILLLNLYHSIDQERDIAASEVLLLQQGASIAKASDYLTNSIRSFTVTGNPAHLENYWFEVDTNKNRDKAVRKLRLLSGKPSEIEYLVKSKMKSDQLVNTEIRAMKLMLDAYKIPNDLRHPAIQNHKLSIQDKLRSQNSKILTAQEILFDSEYERMKGLIMAPLEEFKTKTHSRIVAESHAADKQTDIFLILIIINSLLITALVLSLIFMRISQVQKQS